MRVLLDWVPVFHLRSVRILNRSRDARHTQKRYAQKSGPSFARFGLIKMSARSEPRGLGHLYR